MDFYMQMPQRLNGQPKRTIADYVEKNGILVPRRFSSLEEARKQLSDREIFLRSEHPQDYAGVSDILDSFRLSDTTFVRNGCQTVDDIKENYFDVVKNDDNPKYRAFCRFTGLDEEDFISDATFSIWEYINGSNITVVADTAVPEKYHVFQHSYYPQVFVYSTVENGKVVIHVSKHEYASDERDEDVIIDAYHVYKKVRNLEHFDGNHCPIMEFRRADSKTYFLQYHRTRDFEPPDFALERNAEETEIVPHFIRGATKKDGIYCKVVVNRSEESERKLEKLNAEGIFHINRFSPFTYCNSGQLELQIIDGAVDEPTLRSLTVHSVMSLLFKSHISLIFPLSDIIGREKTDVFDVHLVSDGKKAFIRRV